MGRSWPPWSPLPTGSAPAPIVSYRTSWFTERRHIDHTRPTTARTELTETALQSSRNPRYCSGRLAETSFDLIVSSGKLIIIYAVSGGRGEKTGKTSCVRYTYHLRGIRYSVRRSHTLLLLSLFFFFVLVIFLWNSTCSDYTAGCVRKHPVYLDFKCSNIDYLVDYRCPNKTDVYTTWTVRCGMSPLRKEPRGGFVPYIDK